MKFVSDFNILNRFLLSTVRIVIILIAMVGKFDKIVKLAFVY